MTKALFEKLSLEFSFSYTKSSGPGGQHVNTTDSKVILSWPFLETTCLNESQKNDIQSNLKTYINKENILNVSSSKTRTRARNQEDCLKKLQGLLTKAFYKPPKRKKTRPSRSSIKKRLDSKKKHSDQKKSRKKVDY